MAPVEMEVEVEVVGKGLLGNDMLEEEQRLLEAVQKDERTSHPLCRMRPVFSFPQKPCSVHCRVASRIVVVVMVGVEEEQEEQEKKEQEEQGEGDIGE